MFVGGVGIQPAVPRRALEKPVYSAQLPKIALYFVVGLRPRYERWRFPLFTLSATTQLVYSVLTRRMQDTAIAAHFTAPGTP